MEACRDQTHPKVDTNASKRAGIAADGHAIAWGHVHAMVMHTRSEVQPDVVDIALCSLNSIEA